jgi:hypothetical protein
VVFTGCLHATALLVSAKFQFVFLFTGYSNLLRASRRGGVAGARRAALGWVVWSSEIANSHVTYSTVHGPDGDKRNLLVFFCTAGRGAVGYARDLSCRVSRPDTRTSVLAVSSFSASVCPVGSCRPTRACSRPATLTSSTRPGRSDPFFSPSLRSFCSRVCPAR